jgi:hypothetical protein
MEMRLLKAVSLLVDPDVKIIAVAEKCGFNHLGLFNTCFKKRFGTTPGQWRKSITQATSRSAEEGSTGCPFQTQGLCLPSEKPDGSRLGFGRPRPLERTALCGLLKDIVAVKNGVKLQSFERKEIDGLDLVAGAECVRRSRTGA